MPAPSSNSPSIAIVGGGLAGLSAGCALAESGYRVTIFERRPYLGGRASSYQHPGTGEIVDNCQHVLLGCCTNLINLYQRTGVSERIRWYDRLTFLEPGGRASVIQTSFLPPPLHTAPSFLRAHCLKLEDKLSIVRAMTALMPSVPKDNGRPFLEWLRRHRQTDRAIERFWKTVLVSALNEELDRLSVAYAAQVFRESFLKSSRAGQMGIPSVPLTELYNAAGDYIRARGGEVRLRSSVDSFIATASSVDICSDGQERTFDFALLAVSFDAINRILPTSLEAEPLRTSLQFFESSPITGIHVWFDREVTDLEHAVLLDRTIQWMFNKSRLLGRTQDSGNYLELVVSSSKTLVEKSRSEVIELALSELAEFLPRVRDAKLLKATVIKEVNATYSPAPGLDQYRPGNATSWPRVFLAGDWTATGWPATMEGAVRSGYMAAESLARSAGQSNPQFLVADLPPAGIMRCFSN
ncbi:MAG TPA: hydroxysqualene dehydroxylase HpnE [Terriglobales bacterium]|nr:hydroxysqualene dehydroxylase HpnE [Terriglobales bacterium]